MSVAVVEDVCACPRVEPAASAKKLKYRPRLLLIFVFIILILP
jgi:hypothetical protein